VLVEIQDRDEVVVHASVTETVDAILRSEPYTTQIRKRTTGGQIESFKATITPAGAENNQNHSRGDAYGVERELPETPWWAENDRYNYNDWSAPQSQYSNGYSQSNGKKHGAQRKTGRKAKFLRSA
jgi:hypothetical protein